MHVPSPPPSSPSSLQARHRAHPQRATARHKDHSIVTVHVTLGCFLLLLLLLLLPTHALASWPARAKALKGLPDPNPPTNIRAVARVAPPPELAKGRWLAGQLAGWLPQFSCVLLSREPWAPPPPLPPPPPPPQDMACGPNGKAAARRPGPQAGLHCNPDMGMGGCASSMMPQPRGCTSRFRATLLCTCECKCQGSLHSLVGDAARFGQQPTTSKGGGGVRCFA